jgi:hypothetical protein
MWGNHLTILTKRLQLRRHVDLPLGTIPPFPTSRNAQRPFSAVSPGHGGASSRGTSAQPAATGCKPQCRRNKPGPHRRPAARHDAAPETFPRTTPSTLVLAVLGRGSEADDPLSMETSREADVPAQARRLSPVVPPPPCPSAHANRRGPPVRCTPDAQVHVELALRVVVTQGPSEANVHPRRPGASDDALRRSERLDQVFNQGWVAYFDCHCRCRAPRVAAGEARTSHSRQKRSAVKARSCTPSPRPNDRSAGPRQDAC